jgi:hypothetical protein
MEAIRAEKPSAQLAFVKMDMMELKSMEKAATEIKRCAPTYYSKR